MALLDNLGKTIGKAAQATAAKSREVAGEAQDRLAVAKLEKEIEKNYIVIGQWYYDKYANNPDADMVDIIATISDAFAKIEDITASPVEEAFNEVSAPAAAANTCVACGAELAPGAKFCVACGAAQTVQEAQPVDAKRLCPNCGAEVNGNFCPACGHKMD